MHCARWEPVNTWERGIHFIWRILSWFICIYGFIHAPCLGIWYDSHSRIRQLLVNAHHICYILLSFLKRDWIYWYLEYNTNKDHLISLYFISVLWRCLMRHRMALSKSMLRSELLQEPWNRKERPFFPVSSNACYTAWIRVCRAGTQQTL